MNIKPKEMMFGYPILKVREVIRHAMQDRLFGKNKTEINDKVAILSQTSRPAAAKLVNELISNGYLNLDKESQKKHNEFTLYATELGRKLGVAKAISSITKEKANLLLEELIERAKLINSNPDYACCVARLSVFGSYLSDREKLGDLDVFYKIDRRYDTEKYREMADRSFKNAIANGRRFSSIVEEYIWPYTEILLALKARKRNLSLHDEDSDEVFSKTKSQIVYEFDPSQ